MKGHRRWQAVHTAAMLGGGAPAMTQQLARGGSEPTCSGCAVACHHQPAPHTCDVSMPSAPFGCLCHQPVALALCPWPRIPAAQQQHVNSTVYCSIPAARTQHSALLRSWRACRSNSWHGHSRTGNTNMQPAPACLAAAEQQQGIGVCCRLPHTQLDVLHEAVGLPRHLLQQVGGGDFFSTKPAQVRAATTQACMCCVCRCCRCCCVRPRAGACWLPTAGQEQATSQTCHAAPTF